MLLAHPIDTGCQQGRRAGWNRRVPAGLAGEPAAGKAVRRLPGDRSGRTGAGITVVGDAS